MLPLFATKLASRGPNTTTKKRAHVAVCPFIRPSHPETLFHLSRKIAAANRDVQVTMFTTEYYAMYLYWYWNPDEDENLHFYPVGATPPPNTTSDSEQGVQAYLEVVRRDMRKSFTEAEEELGVRITYVVADAFIAEICREIAEERGVRWSAVWTSTAASMAAFVHNEEIRAKSGVSLVVPDTGPTPAPEWPVEPDNTLPEIIPKSASKDKTFQTVDHYLPGFPPGVPLLNLPNGVLVGPEGINRFPTQKLLRFMPLSLPKAEAVLINSFQHLESEVTSTLLGNTFHLGGVFSLTLPLPQNISIKNSNEIFYWLDTKSTSSVVYIDLGLEYTTQHNITTVAEALEATGVTFVWYIHFTWPEMKLPKGFVHRALESGQGIVLDHYKSPVQLHYREQLILKHKAIGSQMRRGLWSSVTESIASAVPIICWPLPMSNFDQALITTLVESVWGIGVGVDPWLTKDVVERALKRVTVDEEGWKFKEKIAVLKNLAEKDAAEPNGSSTQTLNKFISLVTK